jgi:hypothetical protein
MFRRRNPLEDDADDPGSDLSTLAKIDIERKRQELYGFIDRIKTGKWHRRLDLLARVVALLLGTAASIVLMILMLNHPSASPFAIGAGGLAALAYESWRFYRKMRDDDRDDDDLGGG